MSTWTSRAAAPFGALVLSACVGTMAPSGATPRAVSVADGAVTVTGPAGYCIDRAATRSGSAGAFVLFGTCAALSGSPAASQPARPAVLTASVVPGSADAVTFAASFPAMARFFNSPAGRAALSRSGKAASVSVGSVSSRDGVLYLRLSDSAAGPGQSVAPDYWRAILALRGHFVTLSVMSLSDRPLDPAEKRRILDAFVTRMRAANAGSIAAG
ncbi:MAG: hypothetical protein ACK4NE_02070 [Albidovulum sp.]